MSKILDDTDHLPDKAAVKVKEELLFDFSLWLCWCCGAGEHQQWRAGHWCLPGLRDKCHHPGVHAMVTYVAYSHCHSAVC